MILNVYRIVGTFAIFSFAYFAFCPKKQNITQKSQKCTKTHESNTLALKG